MTVLGPADVRNGSLAEVEERIMDVRLLKLSIWGCHMVFAALLKP